MLRADEIHIPKIKNEMLQKYCNNIRMRYYNIDHYNSSITAYDFFGFHTSI